MEGGDEWRRCSKASTQRSKESTSIGFISSEVDRLFSCEEG